MVTYQMHCRVKVILVIL